LSITLVFAQPLHKIIYIFTLSMKLITSISLSILFMVQAIMPNIDLGCEFEKIAAVYSHYQEHRIFDGDTLLDFVVKEYINNDGNAEKHHENTNHHDLPMQNSHQCSHLTFFLVQQSHFILESFKFTKGIKFDFYKASLSSTYLDTLFQPPRI
jgi:hypothetical protein